MDKSTNLYLPRWVAALYALLAICLVPWIFSLAQSLPSRHLVRHWDAVWVGFDILMLVTMAITVWFAIKRRIWVTISATALATLFILDAWFDIMTSKPGSEQERAIFFGLLEVTLAILTYRLVYVVISRSTPQKRIAVTTKKRHR